MPPTPPDVKSIFGRALEIESPAGRAAYLDEACGPDAGLRAEIEGLLATLGRAREFMRRPAAAVAAGITGAYEPLTEGPGARVGPYKLLQQIGEGGMGVVYMAEQEEPVRRKVALKIIKPGMDSKQVVARFEAERQALAMMDHTNIARVFDAGTTGASVAASARRDSDDARRADAATLAEGRPYFVMELVHGVPITTYCDENKLTPRERLELFVPICHAIQHAHQKGIIHRDLKPSNILVTMYDDKPVPKVIDFGVAKAVEQRLTEKTLFTQYGALVGTFEYMSPEQAEMNAFGVDTRSDIYSLGVLLYELLTGSTPLERQRLREAAFSEIVRLIKEEEPQRPSVRLSTSGTLAKVAAARKTEPAKLSRLMRGELDWVVMRCLEKDRSRRYDTASALARDVERYLKDEPVEAKPPSSGYRLRKFMRRNRGAVAVTGTIAALVVLGGLVSTWQAVRAMHSQEEADRQRLVAVAAELEARAAESRAQAEKANASAALDYINTVILSQARPDLGSDPDITLRTVVDNIAANLKSTRQPPLVEASIRHTLGTIYLNLERYQDAFQHFTRAYEIRKANLTERHPDTIRTMVNLGSPFIWQEEWWGKQGAGKPAESKGERLAVEAWGLAKEVLGPDDLSTLIAMRNVGMYHNWARRHPQGEQLYFQYLQDCIRTRGEADTWSIDALTYLAWHYQGRRMFREAEDYANRAIAIRKKLSEDHYQTYLAIETLAGVYQREGRYADAEPLHRQLIDGFRRHVGDRSLSYLAARANLAFVLNRQGRHEEAVNEYEKALPRMRQVAEYGRGRFSFNLTGYGHSLNQLGRFAEAEPVLREAMAIREDELGGTTPQFFNSRSILGETLLGLKRYQEAERHLLAAHKGQTQPFKDDAEHDRARWLVPTLERLVKLYESWEKPEEAAKWRSELEAARPTPQKAPK